MLFQFLLYSKVNQLYIYTYPLFFGFPCHLGHHRALSRVPCAIQQVLISYLFYTQQCVYTSIPISQFIPPLPSPAPVSIRLSSMSVSVFLLCKEVHLYHKKKNQLLMHQKQLSSQQMPEDNKIFRISQFWKTMCVLCV